MPSIGMVEDSMVAPPVVKIEPCTLESSDSLMTPYHRQPGHLHGYLSRDLHLPRLNG